jgi:hypothetical protein
MVTVFTLLGRCAGYIPVTTFNPHDTEKGTPAKTCPSADECSSGCAGVFIISKNGFKMAKGHP